MRFLTAIFLLSTLFSCGDSSDLTTPATYTFSEISIETITAYRYTNGNYEEIPISEAGDPNTSGMSGGIDLLELVDDSTLKFDDGFGETEASYTVTNDKVSFTANGSSYAMAVLDEGQQLSVQRVGGGDFDDQNPHPIVFATCEDEGCDDVDPSGYIYAGQDGQIGYVIIYSEVYTRQ